MAPTMWGEIMNATSRGVVSTVQKRSMSVNTSKLDPEVIQEVLGPGTHGVTVIGYEKVKGSDFVMFSHFTSQPKTKLKVKKYAELCGTKKDGHPQYLTFTKMEKSIFDRVVSKGALSSDYFTGKEQLNVLNFMELNMEKDVNLRVLHNSQMMVEKRKVSEFVDPNVWRLYIDEGDKTLDYEDTGGIPVVSNSLDELYKALPASGVDSSME